MHRSCTEVLRCVRGTGVGAPQGQRLVVPRRPRSGPGHGQAPPARQARLPHAQGGRGGARRGAHRRSHVARSSSRSTTTTEEFLRDWLASQQHRLRATTLYSYEMAIDRISRRLGKVPLQALTPLQIEKFYAELLRDGGTLGKPLSAKTVRNSHVVLRKALADAERLGLVSRNAAASARPPTAARNRSSRRGRRTTCATSSPASAMTGSSRRCSCSPRPACGAARCSGCAGPTSTSTPASWRSCRR